MDNPNQQPVTPQSLPPTDPSASKPFYGNYGKKKWIKWGLIYAVIAAILYGSVYYFFLAKKTTNPYSTTSPTPTISQPTPTPDETANWETYTNTKYKFSFKYPSDANIVGDAENIAANKVLGQAVSISGPNLDLNMDYSINVDSQSMIKGSEIVTLNGQQWNVLTEDQNGCSPGLGSCTSMFTYQAVINNKLITFTFRGTTDKTIPNQILSTFKFTDQNQTDISNWKTYTNTTFGYSISFPDTYEVPPQTEKQKSQTGVDTNMCVTVKSNVTCYIAINASTNDKKLALQDWINQNTILIYHSSPGTSQKFNNYDALLVKTATDTNYFLAHNSNIYQIQFGSIQTLELSKILSTFKFTQ